MTPTGAGPALPARPRPATASALLRWLTPTVWTMIPLAAVTALALTYFLNTGDAVAAVRLANRAIDASLEPGEAVLARVNVRRRYWWDYFRVTHGVVAATDRRLVYVGLPPKPLLRQEDGPAELDDADFPYAVAPTAQLHAVAFGTQPGVTLSGGGRTATFGYLRSDAGSLRRTLAVVTGALERARAAADAERRATEAAAAASRRAIHHRVQRGEALASIARRYGVPVESLQAWNALPTMGIRAGQRLLVRPGTN